MRTNLDICKIARLYVENDYKLSQRKKKIISVLLNFGTWRYVRVQDDTKTTSHHNY